MLLVFLSLCLFGQTITEIVVNSTDHEILEDAVIAAELDDDLSGPGPFTLFAPTDAAFNALPAGTLDALLLDPTGDLAQILLYHVLGAEVLSTDLSNGQMAATLQGEDITVTINGTDVFINDAQVTVVNIEASNGVVHVIDAVLLPPSVLSTSPISESVIALSPNPVDELINIQFPSEMTGEKQLQLMDASGRLLHTQLISDDIGKINLSAYSSGIYFIRIDTTDGSYFDKIVKK
ncbi:MAG: hypothetical protein ACI8YQ_001378 [Polaribacter sp.]